jgi:hypothetical protein
MSPTRTAYSTSSMDMGLANSFVNSEEWNGRSQGQRWPVQGQDDATVACLACHQDIGHATSALARAAVRSLSASSQSRPRHTRGSRLLTPGRDVAASAPRPSAA